MRSASSPAGTAGRAGSAEGSPAGEWSGRGVVPGSVQDGETSTVDQSREWPFRDTAPRQDPTESRIDPIWGGDPPDAVRWHMDMAGDQEADDSQSPSARTKPKAGDRPGPTSAPPQQQTPVGSPQPRNDAEDEAGWFSPDPAAASFSGMLSEQLSAARPVAEPGPAQAAGPPPASTSSGPQRAGSPPGAVASPGTTSLAGGSTGVQGERRGPELIEAGMVYVDPDPEIGSPPSPAGGIAPVTARSGQYDDESAGQPTPEKRPGDQPATPVRQAPPDLNQSAVPRTRTGATTERGLAAAEPVRPASDASAPETDPADPAAPDRESTASVGHRPDRQSVDVPDQALTPEAGASPPNEGGAEARPPSSDGEVRPGSHGEQPRPGGAEGEPRSDRPPSGEDQGTDPSPSADRSLRDEEGREGQASPEDHGRARGAPASDLRDGLEGTPDETFHEAPWSEPALPMAWPLATTPSIREAGGGFSDEDAAADDLIPQPDPSWPRLFGRPIQAEHQGTRSASASKSLGAGESMDVDGSASDHAHDAPGPADRPEPGHETSASPPRLHTREASDAAFGAAGSSPIVGRAAAFQSDPPAEIDLTSSTEPATRPSRGQPGDPTQTSERRAPIPSSGAQPAGAATGGRRESIDSTGGDHSPTDGVGAEELIGASSGRASDSDRAIAGEPSRTAAPATSGRESGAAGADATAQANMSATARVANVGPADPPLDSASPRSGDVSRETSAVGGGEVNQGREDEPLQDEASVAVREAASRAALEAGVDVSRETDLTASEGLTEGSYGDLTIDSDAAAKTARVSFRIERDALNGTRRVVAVANQKGGVGKSTTAVNIGAYLALAGARVLVVDLDPQGNASTGLGLDHRDIDPSIYDVLTGDTQPMAAIRTTGVTNLHILPSTIDLAGAEVELVSAMSRETRLRRALQSVDHQYDAVLIDCPPSLGLLTLNALAAADELLIPIQCEYYALEGLGQLLRNVELVRANLNPELRIGGIVLTMYDGRTRLALQVVEEVRKHFTDIVFQTVVPRSVRLSEAPGYGLPIALYDPLSRGGIAYRDLTFELAERSGLLAQTGEGAS